MKAPLDGTDVDVSRESRDRLVLYVGLLERWQQRLNLVGPATMKDVWQRHIADSLALLPLLPPGPCLLVDLGTGAGLPGIPLAIARPDIAVVLVDSNAKKSAFLREAVRITGVSATIVTKRIEQLAPADLAAVPDVIVSRAAAPLPILLDWTSRIAGPQTLCLFHKGQDVDAELTAATKCWRFNLVRHSSRVQNDSWILEIRNVARTG